MEVPEPFPDVCPDCEDEDNEWVEYWREIPDEIKLDPVPAVACECGVIVIDVNGHIEW